MINIYIYDKYIIYILHIAISTFHCKQTGQKHIRFFMSLQSFGGWSPVLKGLDGFGIDGLVAVNKRETDTSSVRIH